MRVPLGKGNRQVVGYLVALESRSVAGRKLKPVTDVVDRRSLLSPSMLRLTRWMADYYLCSCGAGAGDRRAGRSSLAGRHPGGGFRAAWRRAWPTGSTS